MNRKNWTPELPFETLGLKLGEECGEVLGEISDLTAKPPKNWAAHMDALDHLQEELDQVIFLASQLQKKVTREKDALFGVKSSESLR